MFVVLAFLIFTVALASAGYYVWSVPQQQANDKLAGRLRELRLSGSARAYASSDLVRGEARGRFAPLAEFMAWLGILRRLQEYIDQANLKHRASEVFALSIGIAAVVYFVLGFFRLDLLLLRMGIAAAIGAIPVGYIMRVRARRLRKFEENLPDAIDLFNRSMRAGHNIHAGLETIAQETGDPVKMEFRKVVEELALGAPIEQALHGLGRRVPVIDLKFFITGLILQRQTGANMVEVLENLTGLVRERLNLMARMKAATAQQRLSGGLLCAIPIVFAFALAFMKPEYIQLLTADPRGRFGLTAAVVSEVVGILVIRKIVNPRF